MEVTENNLGNRVNENTSNQRNEKIDQKMLDDIRDYRSLSPQEINLKIEKLRREWDIERALEVQTSVIGLYGILMGTLSSKRWFILTAVVSSLVLQHGLRRWSPAVSVLRALGFRTRREIDEEIYILKELSGDFNSLSPESSAVEILSTFRK